MARSRTTSCPRIFRIARGENPVSCCRASTTWARRISNAEPNRSQAGLTAAPFYPSPDPLVMTAPRPTELRGERGGEHGGADGAVFVLLLSWPWHRIPGTAQAPGRRIHGVVAQCCRRSDHRRPRQVGPVLGLSAVVAARMVGGRRCADPDVAHAQRQGRYPPGG